MGGEKTDFAVLFKAREAFSYVKKHPILVNIL